MANGDQPRIVYVMKNASGQELVGWRDLGNPASEGTAAIYPGGGRWVDGEPSFTSVQIIDGYIQAVQVDASTGVVTQLTLDRGSKLILPWMLWAPEYNEYVLLNQVGLSKLALYRKVRGYWLRHYEITLPSSKPYVSSAKPFVAGGRLYVSVIAVAQYDKIGPIGPQPVGPTEIWIAGLDPEQPFFRRVDDPTSEAKRTEPEVLQLAGGPVVYYTEIEEPSGRRMLRRAVTMTCPTFLCQ